MKQNMVFADPVDDAAQAAAWLKKIRRGLLIGLGAILTFITLALSSPRPFLGGFLAIFLWLTLLLVPAAAGFVVYFFPSWQNLALARRKDVICQSFALSVATLGTAILFSLKWTPYQAGHWVASALATGIYGGFFIWLALRLRRQVRQEKDELFP